MQVIGRTEWLSYFKLKIVCALESGTVTELQEIRSGKPGQVLLVPATINSDRHN